MAKVQVNRLTNANVYLDGVNFLGRAEEVTLPVIKPKMVEHKGLGMAGAIELPAGFEKLEAKIKWSSLYPEVLRKAGDVFRAVQLQVRASLETFTGQGRVQEQGVVAHITGTFKGFPMGTFKQHDGVELETELSVTYCRLVVGGADVVELDVMANIYKVAGVDRLAAYRRNVGA